MRATLHIISGPQKGRSFLVRGGEICRFGRSDWAADVALPQDRYLADRHFSLDCTGEHCLLKDLGTPSGTYINGERQLSMLVHDGDEIVAGKTQFRLVIEGERAGPSEPEQIPLPLTVSIEDPLRPFEAAVIDEDPSVRWEALNAAAWGRRTWLLDYCRATSAYPRAEHWEALLMLAILGQPQDLERILAVGRAPELGPARFELMGKFGHPGIVDELLIRIESSDAPTALAAGDAFVRLTGLEIESEEVTEATPTEADADSGTTEDASAEAAPLPDPRQVRALWARERNRFLQGTRWSCGVDLSRGGSPAILDRLDLESCWETRMRDHFFGRVKSGPLVFSQFRP